MADIFLSQRQARLQSLIEKGLKEGSKVDYHEVEATVVRIDNERGLVRIQERPSYPPYDVEPHNIELLDQE